MFICFLLPMMIQTTIVSSRILRSWWDLSIRVITIKHISVDSACMDSRIIIHLGINLSVEKTDKEMKEKLEELNELNFQMNLL